MISGILLAAGAARRFGGGKLVQPLADGTPVALAALRNLQAALDRVVVVVRPDDTAVAHLFSETGIDVVVCADADRGMGHSLAAGVGHERAADGWVIALADMPRVKPQTIRSIVSTLESRQGIVIPCIRGERGHPVAFGARYRDELTGLQGDSGARSILQAHPESVFRLDVDDGGILQDVDTPADLQRLRGS